MENTTMTTTSLDLSAARDLRDALAAMLAKERGAAAYFLVALADFDRRRGWEPLGHASLFAFLHVELGLSKGGAFFRQTAARLLQRFPDLIEPLRDGRLCITTVVELAKVLTEANQAEVLPRFYGRSSQEAKEVVAALAPMPSPPTRAVVTSVTAPKVAGRAPVMDSAPRLATPAGTSVTLTTGAVQSTEPAVPDTARAPDRRAEVEPLTAELRRLHITVDRQFLKLLDVARDGLSHSIPGASTEQVLKAALEHLVEKQARARGQVKRPRAVQPLPTSTPAPAPTSTAPETLPPPPTSTASEPLHRRAGPRETIPAAVRRAVWDRDGGRCQWPLDSGGCCGSTHLLELDHVVPWPRGGTPTVDGLRLLCRPHNLLAARHAFGAQCMGRYAGTLGDRPGRGRSRTG